MGPKADQRGIGNLSAIDAKRSSSATPCRRETIPFLPEPPHAGPDLAFHGLLFFFARLGASLVAVVSLRRIRDNNPVFTNQ